MLLENLAYTEVEDYLESKDIILVPIGAVEQHSAYGLIGTDFIVAESIARTAGDRLDILVAPTVSYAVSPHHMAFKGTIALSPSTLITVVEDIVKSLVAHGFRRVLFINGHGGNIVPLQTAFQQLKDQNVTGYFDVISWYMDSEVKRLCKEAFGDDEGLHATPSEVSITKHLRPSVFSGKAVGEKVVEKPTYYWPLSATEMKRVFPDGRMQSAPWLATRELGEKIAAKAARVLEQKIKTIMELTILSLLFCLI
jgi:creatinine amidohydrolase